MSRSIVFCATAICAVLLAGPARAADGVTCKQYVQEWTRFNGTPVFQRMVRAYPETEKMSNLEGVKANAARLMRSKTLEERVYAYLILLMEGDDEAKQMVAEAAAALKTDEERAYFYFALGMAKLHDDTAKTAQEGRDLLKQIHATGYITFPKQYFWGHVTERCTLPK